MKKASYKYIKEIERQYHVDEEEQAITLLPEDNEPQMLEISDSSNELLIIDETIVESQVVQEKEYQPIVFTNKSGPYSSLNINPDQLTPRLILEYARQCTPPDLLALSQILTTQMLEEYTHDQFVDAVFIYSLTHEISEKDVFIFHKGIQYFTPWKFDVQVEMFWLHLLYQYHYISAEQCADIVRSKSIDGVLIEKQNAIEFISQNILQDKAFLDVVDWEDWPHIISPQQTIRLCNSLKEISYLFPEVILELYDHILSFINAVKNIFDEEYETWDDEALKSLHELIEEL